MVHDHSLASNSIIFFQCFFNHAGFFCFGLRKKLKLLANQLVVVFLFVMEYYGILVQLRCFMVKS